MTSSSRRQESFYPLEDGRDEAWYENVEAHVLAESQQLLRADPARFVGHAEGFAPQIDDSDVKKRLHERFPKLLLF